MSSFAEPLLGNVLLVSGLWLLSLYRRKASLIDPVWSLMFVMAALIWFSFPSATPEQWLVLLLIVFWGARLYVHLTWRNWGEPEDRRYRAIRRRHSPGYWWKSYFIVFLLQALLAWLASFSIYGALKVDNFGLLEMAGIALALTGLFFEVVGDWQLARFKGQAGNQHRILDSGLWRYTRHPNYFGECCFWWGVYLLAVGAGFWWTLLSPVLVTVLLLRISGVSLLEADIVERRPDYSRYMQTTSAFLPRLPKTKGQGVL